MFRTGSGSAATESPDGVAPSAPPRPGPAPSGKGRRGFFYGWWMVAIAYAIQFIAGGFYGIGFSVYFLPITRDLELSRTAISLVFSFRTLQGGLNGPVVGYLIDRFGPRLMMWVGCAMTGLGFILLAFVNDY